MSSEKEGERGGGHEKKKKYTGDQIDYRTVRGTTVGRNGLQVQ